MTTEHNWTPWETLAEFLSSDKVAYLNDGDANLIIKTDVCEYVYRIKLEQNESNIMLEELNAVGDWLKPKLIENENLTKGEDL